MKNAVKVRLTRLAAIGSLVIFGATSVSCSKFESKTYADERKRLGELSESAKNRLHSNAREFGAMAEVERERLRKLYAEIEETEGLVLYLEAYHSWLNSLTEDDRKKILAAKNDDERLSIVRSIREEEDIRLAEQLKKAEELAKKEQELNEKSASLDARERELREARVRKNEMVSRIMRVTPEDQITVFDWLSSLVKKNREKMLESMPEEMSRKMRQLGGDEAGQTKLLVMALVNRKLAADPRFVSKEEFEQLRSGLSGDARAKIDGLEDHGQRIFVLQQWGWGGFWATHYSQVTPAQLETFRKQLKPALREALEKETPIEGEMHLRRLYARSQSLNVPPDKLDESGLGEAFAFIPRVNNGPNPDEPPRKGPPGGPGGFRPNGPRPPRPGDFQRGFFEGPPPGEGRPEGSPPGEGSEGGPPRGDRPPRGEGGGFDDRPLPF